MIGVKEILKLEIQEGTLVMNDGSKGNSVKHRRHRKHTTTMFGSAEQRVVP